jgi:Na+-transporting NADH:ubiquinone oxidoreductase subunit NqrD
MTIGTSLFLIGVGAILRYAVTATVSGINIQTVGLILLAVGALGLVLSVAWTMRWSRPRRTVAARDPHTAPTQVVRDRPHR